MALKNNKVEELVQEGIELSFSVMESIYRTKKRKMVFLFLLFTALLTFVVVLLWKTEHLVYAVPVGIGGIAGLVFLFFYDIKELQSLKRELDALSHYINS